jgi:hypothetical protein
MKKGKLIFASVGLSCVLLLSSCIGSFTLTNKVLAWNKTAGNKFVNEAVFVCFNIIPVYSVAIFADAVVLNTIEFWTGSNPVAANSVKYIKGDKGNYKVESNQAGYKITNESTKEQVVLSYNKDNNSWSAQSNGETVTFMTFIDANHVKMFGSDKVVELSQAGVLAYQAIAEANMSVACK